jgi:hypothetical protein
MPPASTLLQNQNSKKNEKLGFFSVKRKRGGECAGDISTIAGFEFHPCTIISFY